MIVRFQQVVIGNFDMALGFCRVVVAEAVGRIFVRLRRRFQMLCCLCMVLLRRCCRGCFLRLRWKECHLKIFQKLESARACTSGAPDLRHHFLRVDPVCLSATEL
jgi:hypothetical protein